MTGADRPARLAVVVCFLLVTAGVGVGAPALPADEPTGSSALDTAAAPSQGTAQLSETLFRRPSDTVSEPEIDVALADPVVEPGTETTVELTVVNTGQIEAGSTLDEETATARGVTVTVDDEDAPVEVDGETTAIGSIPPGESVTVPLSITAPASADGDGGELDVEVEYTYTEIDEDDDDEDVADDETDTEEFDVDIEVGDRSRFAIEDTDTDVQVGTDGVVDVELENVGEADAENVRVTARSPTGGVTIGAGSGGGTATGVDARGRANGNGNGNASVSERADMSTESAAFVGELDEGDDETVSFDTRIDPELSVESYLLEVSVVYEDEDGILRESPTLATAVEPTGSQTFSITGVDSSLEVGDSGTITATLENTGPVAVGTPVVRANPASDRIDIGENQVAVADLDEDESANISFDAAVSGEADPGSRPVTFTVEYGVDDERLDSDPFVRRVPVRAEQPAFTIDADGEVPAGTTQTVQLNVTNNRNERLSNINVFLYPDGPLDVDSDEAFISDLDPGESETIAVDVSVDEGAEQRASPLEVDFRYDTETDDDLISQVYQVPITVTEPPEDDGLLPSLLSLAGVTAVLVGGIVVVRRRR